MPLVGRSPRIGLQKPLKADNEKRRYVGVTLEQKALLIGHDRTSMRKLKKMVMDRFGVDEQEAALVVVRWLRSCAAAFVLLASSASGQACGTYYVKLAESQCGQTLTTADSLFALAYGITADELRMVDTYVSGQTVNQCASVWKFMTHEPERCPPIDRPLFTKVKTCP